MQKIKVLPKAFYVPRNAEDEKFKNNVTTGFSQESMGVDLRTKMVIDYSENVLLGRLVVEQKFCDPSHIFVQHSQKQAEIEKSNQEAVVVEKSSRAKEYNEWILKNLFAVAKQQNLEDVAMDACRSFGMKLARAHIAGKMDYEKLESENLVYFLELSDIKFNERYKEFALIEECEDDIIFPFDGNLLQIKLSIKKDLKKIVLYEIDDEYIARILGSYLGQLKIDKKKKRNFVEELLMEVYFEKQQYREEFREKSSKIFVKILKIIRN